MGRLIDADAFMKAMYHRAFETDGDTMWQSGCWVRYRAVEQTVREQPTVDAVPVVRCKGCRWGREVCGNIECFVDSNIPLEYHGYEWFCPNGERRTDGTAD